MTEGQLYSQFQHHHQRCFRSVVKIRLGSVIETEWSTVAHTTEVRALANIRMIVADFMLAMG